VSAIESRIDGFILHNI